jgi:hypothetical protein
MREKHECVALLPKVFNISVSENITEIRSSVFWYITSRSLYTPEDRISHIYRCDNLKSYITK